jgi:ABC-2 type transport system permease protein
MSTVALDTRARPYNNTVEFVRTVYLVGAREIRNLIRTPAAFIPSFFIPLFFFFVQSASLTKLAQGSGAVADYKSFILPVSILFAVSNEGAGFNMVQDIERGYFDRLMLSPAARPALLVGFVGANFAGVVLKSSIVMLLAMLFGANIVTGFFGIFPMILLAATWGVVFAGIGMAVAIRTGNAQAVQGALVFLFPLLFLTTSFAPKAAMETWMRTAVTYNPLTYILEGMRSFTTYGFQWGTVGKALLALAIMAPITMGLALSAHRARQR